MGIGIDGSMAEFVFFRNLSMSISVEFEFVLLSISVGSSHIGNDVV